MMIIIMAVVTRSLSIRRPAGAMATGAHAHPIRLLTRLRAATAGVVAGGGLLRARRPRSHRHHAVVVAVAVAVADGAGKTKVQ